MAARDGDQPPQRNGRLRIPLPFQNALKAAGDVKPPEEPPRKSCSQKPGPTKELVVVAEAMITCPNCGHQESEAMPTDACRFFYRCEGCGTTLKPREGDCCVFCSYADADCPPKERGDC